ncbi:MAG: hypothetical protein H7096_11585 [Flavobacterium sp.]|nr:hypothetical protein [Pedobacter sp.]
MLNLSPGFYEWTSPELVSLKEVYFSFWLNHADQKWGDLMWRFLKKAGLHQFDNQNEEGLVRERLVVLAMIYFELCERSGFHEETNFQHWSTAKRREFVNDTDFSELNPKIEQVVSAIQNHYETEDFLSEFLVSAYEGSTNTRLSIDEIIQIKEDISTHYMDNRDLFMFWQHECNDYMKYNFDPTLT